VGPRPHPGGGVSVVTGLISKVEVSKPPEPRS
jgi:hypothetical protein